MTYYEKYQTLVDEATTKAIKGVIPSSCATEIQQKFEEWKASTSVEVASKEVENTCSQM